MTDLTYDERHAIDNLLRDIAFARTLPQGARARGVYWLDQYHRTALGLLVEHANGDRYVYRYDGTCRRADS